MKTLNCGIAEVEEGGLDIAALEAEAAAEGGHQDRGSRATRVAKDEREAAEREAKEADRQARYNSLPLLY